MCDFSNDCEDDSDEQDCSDYVRCDFEDKNNPICDWNYDDDAPMYWQRSRAARFVSSIYYPIYGIYIYQ